MTYFERRWRFRTMPSAGEFIVGVMFAGLLYGLLLVTP